VLPIMPGIKNRQISDIIEKYAEPLPQPPQPAPPQPAPPQTPQLLPNFKGNGGKIFLVALNEAVTAGDVQKAWGIIKAIMDTAFLWALMMDPKVTAKIKEVATLLLLVIASNCICDKKRDKAKNVLDELGVVPISTEHEPYTYTYEIDAILRQRYNGAIGLSQDHKCAICVSVPTLENNRDTCSRHNCAGCRHFTDGHDTTRIHGSIYACPTVQGQMAWANMLRSLVPLAKNVAHSAKYKYISEDFNLLLGIWRFNFFIWRLPRLFTSTKSSEYLLGALGLFVDQAGCTGVIWRHVTLLLQMQQVLQIKARTPLKGETSSENMQTLAEFQTRFGEFLPPLSSPPPPLSSPPPPHSSPPPLPSLSQ